jgi:hypothetical protein
MMKISSLSDGHLIIWPKGMAKTPLPETYQTIIKGE